MGRQSLTLSLGIAGQALAARPDDQRFHRAAAVVGLSAAALLLQPEQVVVAAVIVSLVSTLRSRRTPWRRQALELATDILAGLAAWAAATLVTLGATPLVGTNGSLALAALAACLALVVTVRAPLLLAERLRAAPTAAWSWDPSLAGTAGDLVLAALGVSFAAMWQLNPWLVAFAAAPLVLVQRSIRIHRLEHETRLDPKTGLFNARHFDAALDRELALARTLDRPLAVLVLDLDLLRDINAAHGHLGGDAVLRGVGRILGASLRPGDVAARFGGEEFAVILPGSDVERGMEVAERLRRAVASTSFRSQAGGPPIRASVSVGVAAFPTHATTPTELVHLADLAVYRAKLQGRNRVFSASTDPLAGAPHLVALPAPSRDDAALAAEAGEDDRGPAPPPVLPVAAASAALALPVAFALPHPDVVLAAGALAAASVASLLLLRRRRSDAVAADETRRQAERLWRAADSLHAQTISLERQNRLLRERSAAAMEMLSAAIDARDSHTAGHSRRVERVALAIGRELGLSQAELDVLGQAARFHDIGKLAVPEAILLKPARLDGEEWQVIRRHPDESARLIERLGFLADALPAIRHHHERYDGSGYPDGLAGEDIPLGARIIHLADALDAMLTPRVYRPALSSAAALEELRRGAGTQFCPRCLEALDRIMLAEPADGADVPHELLAC